MTYYEGVTGSPSLFVCGYKKNNFLWVPTNFFLYLHTKREGKPVTFVGTHKKKFVPTKNCPTNRAFQPGMMYVVLQVKRSGPKCTDDSWRQ